MAHLQAKLTKNRLWAEVFISQEMNIRGEKYVTFVGTYADPSRIPARFEDDTIDEVRVRLRDQLGFTQAEIDACTDLDIIFGS